MHPASKITDLLQSGIGTLYSRRRVPFPGKQAIRNCRIVSHRGEHNRQTPENTLPAFDRVRAAGVWGVEFDVRWTRDLHPVVIHDPDLNRVFGMNLSVGQVSLAQLKERCPMIPTLIQVVHRYGKKIHLMMELKSEPYPDPVRQNRILRDTLSGLSPCTDYHLMSLAPEMFRHATGLPPQLFLPIAELNVPAMSRLALQQDLGGITGHFVLIRSTRIETHHARQQKVGTGFVDSPGCLYREVRRGVDWIFSNRAAALQALGH